MATDVAECPYFSAVAAHEHDWLAGSFRGDEIAAAQQLFPASDRLPGAREDPLAFKVSNCGIDVTACWKRARPRQIRLKGW
jgi:hypothetical protein